MPQRRAFTLVELLVVIGIIAILIAILLPALSRAKQQATKTACAASLRELGNMLRIYAAENKDVLPMGYMDQMGFAYIMNHNNAISSPPRLSQMGLLAATNIIKNQGKAFYCPAEIEEQYMYDSLSNPWIFKDPNHPYFTQNGANRHTRLGFQARPVADWPHSGEYPAGSTGDRLPLLTPEYLPAAQMFGFPKLSKQKSHALLSDMIQWPSAVKRRHKTGVNVLFANASVQFVDLSKQLKGRSFATNSNWQGWYGVLEGSYPIDAEDYNSQSNWPYYRPGTKTASVNRPPSGIWPELDNQSR